MCAQTFLTRVASSAEYCKKLSKKDALGKDVSDIESESSDEEEKPFHHPFQVRDRPNSIIMNIKVQFLFFNN